MKKLSVWLVGLSVLFCLSGSSCATTVERGKGKKIIDSRQKQHQKKFWKDYSRPKHRLK